MPIPRKDTRSKNLYNGKTFTLKWKDSYSMFEDSFTGKITDKKLLKAGLVVERNV